MHYPDAQFYVGPFSSLKALAPPCLLALFAERFEVDAAVLCLDSGDALLLLEHAFLLGEAHRTQ